MSLNFSRRSRGHGVRMRTFVVIQLTFHNRLEIVRPVAVTRKILVDHDSGLELAFEEIALVQEDDHGCLGQELGSDDGSPQDEGVLETIYFRVLRNRFGKT